MPISCVLLLLRLRCHDVGADLSTRAMVPPWRHHCIHVDNERSGRVSRSRRSREDVDSQQNATKWKLVKDISSYSIFVFSLFLPHIRCCSIGSGAIIALFEIKIMNSVA